MAGMLLCIGSASPAEVSFHCSYDGSLEADRAAGPGFGVCRQEQFVEGKRGRALLVGPNESGIAYVQEGNMDKERGSIELWVQPMWPTGDNAWRAFLREEAPRKAGHNALWLWKYGESLRFDVRDPGDHYLTVNIRKWSQGEWRHVVATWDAKVGTRLYIDGKLEASRDFEWIPRPHARFFVGNTGRGDQPAHAALDELCIYTHALSPDEVTAAYQGRLERTLRKPGVAARREATQKPAKLIFHLPFDGSCDAVEAGGSAKPLQTKGVQFAPGIKGQAAQFGEGARLRFSEHGNLVKERGTLMLWFRPDWSGDQGYTSDHREIWRCLFTEGPPTAKRHGSNRLWLWFWRSRLRFDVSDFADLYITKPIVEWKAGEWHHIAVTWDHRRQRVVYVDGERLRGGQDSRKAFLPMRWEALPFPEFYVGSDGGSRVAEGCIDELKVFDAPLSDSAVRAEFGKVFPLVVHSPRRHFLAGRPTRLRWALRNGSSSGVRGAIAWELAQPNGRRVLGEERVPFSLPAGGRKEFASMFTPPAAGEYRLVCRWEPNGSGMRQERRLSFWGVEPDAQRAAGGDLDLKLVESIDCAEELPATRLVAFGQTRVIRSALGAYREAAGERHSRFALRVSLPKLGRPYVIDWEYPDDKPRTMDMIAQTVRSGTAQYELQTGVFCGGEYPLSNSMMTQRSIFWPRGKDIAVIFMTAEEGRPVAAAKVSVYEVQGRLPKLPVQPAAPVDGWSRMVGLYYEDPALCYDFGGYSAMPEFKLTMDRLMDYMDYFGQNLFMYPAVWYNGPFYPSESQGTAMSRAHPFNFIEYMLLRFGERDMCFIPTLNQHNMPSLAGVKWDNTMLTTGDAAKTPITMLWDGAPNMTGWHGTPPNYNPLHPDVRAALLNMVDEMLDLYADFPAFKGICFHLTKHCMLWFGHIDAGYNDYCVEAFEADTGMLAGVAKDDPGRVNKRYRWLMANAHKQWIDWRCRKLHELYAEIAAKLRSRRPDLKVILNLYRPNKKDIVQDPRFERVEDYVGEINRESGVDTALYKGDDNIVVQRTIYPADYRWYRAHHNPKEDPIGIGRLNYAKRHHGLLRTGGEAWINMHDRYWEDSIAIAKKWPAFWGSECGWRVSTLNPNQDHCLESYAKPLAQVDAFVFTKGGFLVGTIGMEEQTGRFTRAFRSLPAKAFQDLPGPEGPVKVRCLRDAEGMYVYLVNPTPKQAQVALRFGGEVRSLRDLATGESMVAAKGLCRFQVSGYGLRACLAKGQDVSVSYARQ